MQIISGIVHSAQKVVVYGPEGIGKSTFASKFPDPLFIDTEGSTKRLNVKRFEKASSWEMLKAQVDYVCKAKPCKTLIIDTIDWAEQLCIDSVCAAHGKKGIEDFGYGNGYVYEKEEFGKFLNLLEEVINVGIHVVLTAHAILRKFEQPDEMGAYDRWELKLGKKTTNLIAPMVKEWADMVLFANYKTMSVAVDKDGKKHKAQGGRRVMYTSHHPCWDAKNRDGLPEEVEFDYSVIKHIIEANVDSTPTVTEEPPKEKPVQITEPTPAEPATVPNSEIPKALADLMVKDNITEKQIRQAVASKGYFPLDMPVQDYPTDFINGVLVAAWNQVLTIIEQNEKDLPF